MADEKATNQGSGLSRLKITKKTYVFDVRKKYAANRNFLLKKAAETPAEDIRQKVQEFLKRRSAQGGEQEKKEREERQKSALAQQAKPSSPAMSHVKMAVAVVLFLVLSSAVFVWLQLSALSPSGATVPPAVFSGNFSSRITQADLLSYQQGESYLRMGYLLINYDGASISNLSYQIKLLPQKPPSQAYLLDYERDSADSYPSFRRKLFESLSRDGIPINEITMDKLPQLPGGATVIIPTGYFPAELLGIGNPFTYKDLLARGNNILYIGLPFDEDALDRRGTAVHVGRQDVAFSRARAASAEGFALYDGQYFAVPSGGQSGIASGPQLYGSVSTIRAGEGIMFFLPQSLDGGWRGDGEKAAEDVARILREERWLAPYSEQVVGADLGALDKAPLSVFTKPFSSDTAYVEFSETAADLQGISKRAVRVFQIGKRQKGEMASRDPVAVPTYLSGQRARLNIDLREDSPALVKLYVNLYKDGLQVHSEELELGLTTPTLEKPKDIELDVPPGRYIIRVEDKGGKVYAATGIDVADLDVQADSAKWQTGSFSFSLSSAGAQVSPKSLSVSIDGRGEKQYTASSLSYAGSKTALQYDYPGEIKPGNHIFSFRAGSYTKPVPLEYRQSKQFWDNPLVIVLGLLSLGIFAIGMVLRRPEKMRYGLDIPDFPPLSTIKIPVKHETVLEIFDAVNSSYSWQWMPLRPEEIKNGFRRLTYNGKPILIGDFNLDRVLAKLLEEGLVKEELGYFGPVKWEGESRRSIPYLAVYRILRNVFVNNAVKFSKLGAMPDCDVKAIVGKEELYLHIMQKPEENVVHRALATAKRGTTIIVFASEEERDKFRNSLTSTSKLAVALKMEVNAGNILLLPVKNAITSYLKGIVK